MFDVFHFDIDQHVEKVDLPVENLQIGDVAAVFGDHRRQITKRAGCVADRQRDPRHMRLLGVGVFPCHIKPTLGLVLELLEFFAVDGVDRHAATGGDDADDAITRQRMAATGEMHRHPRDQALDRHALATLAVAGAIVGD